MFEEGKLISFVGVFVTDEAWLFKAKKRAYTLFPNVRSLILFRSYRSQPSMAICFFFSTVGFASFFGTKSLQDTMLELRLDILLASHSHRHRSFCCRLRHNALCGCSGRSFSPSRPRPVPFAAWIGQITILQRSLNLFFLKARQIHIQLIAVCLFSLISVFIRYDAALLSIQLFL